MGAYVNTRKLSLQVCSTWERSLQSIKTMSLYD